MALLSVLVIDEMHCVKSEENGSICDVPRGNRHNQTWIIASGGSRISRWGSPSGGGTPTSDVGTFRQKCMYKRKNWILLGRGGGGVRQWHPT